jgi:hypothetical protein
MPDKARLYLPHEWRDGAMFIARSLGIGSPETLPKADWTGVLARLEARMTSEGIKPPEGWQAALAKQVCRDDG